MFKILMNEHTEQEKQLQKSQKKERKLKGELDPRKPINKHIHAAMDGKVNAFGRLADQVARRNPTLKKKIIVLIDGASSLENRFKEEMEKRQWTNRVDAFILDIFHTTEYLWNAGTALYGKKSPQRQIWVREKLLATLKGRTGRIIGGLRQILKKDKKGLKTSQKKTLQTVITYFDNHKHMMRYNEYLKKDIQLALEWLRGHVGV